LQVCGDRVTVDVARPVLWRGAL